MSDGYTTREYSRPVLVLTPLIHLFAGPEPQLLGLYQPQLLPDYDPSIFGLGRALLAQQNIHDTADRLVAPWDLQSALRPGTLVVVEATLIVYSFCSDNPATVRIPSTFV